MSLGSSFSLFVLWDSRADLFSPKVLFQLQARWMWSTLFFRRGLKWSKIWRHTWACMRIEKKLHPQTDMTFFFEMKLPKLRDVMDAGSVGGSVGPTPVVHLDWRFGWALVVVARCYQRSAHYASDCCLTTWKFYKHILWIIYSYRKYIVYIHKCIYAYRIYILYIYALYIHISIHIHIHIYIHLYVCLYFYSYLNLYVEMCLPTFFRPLPETSKNSGLVLSIQVGTSLGHLGGDLIICLFLPLKWGKIPIFWRAYFSDGLNQTTNYSH